MSPALLDLLVAVVGLLLYFFARTSGKAQEIGRVMFFCGLLALLMSGAALRL